MAANTHLSVTGLDFTTQRRKLRDFIAAKPEFRDFDFNDSAIGLLLDVLAYNGYYIGFFGNMETAEGFIDSAQLRDSVVSRAKAIGYLPRSARGASANVRIDFASSVANSSFRTITVPRNTRFTSVMNGASLTFVTPRTYTVVANTTQGFGDYIELREGYPLTHRWTYSTANSAFVLPNPGVDTRSIQVAVTTNGSVETYEVADDVLEVTGNTASFFVDADKDERYVVSFGDGYIGKRPALNSSVAVTYLVSTAGKGNGANTFSGTGPIDGQIGYVLSSVSRASGGAQIEDIESIRTAAPRSYETQNRAVAADDYRRVVLRDNSDVAAATCWGGEDNVPPIYGKVFMCLKPVVGSRFSTARKNQIRLSARKRNVMAIDIEIVDPSYLYVVPQVTVRYDSRETSKTAGEIGAAVASAVVAYETSSLNAFDGKFRFSRFLDSVDSSDPGIVTSDATIRGEKRFSPALDAQNTYHVCFSQPLVHPYVGFKYAISSSGFFLGVRECFLDDDGAGVVRAYYNADGGRTYVANVGTVDYETGEVKITSLVPNSLVGPEMSVYAALRRPNVSPVRNQLLLVSGATVEVVNDATGITEARIGSVSTIGQSASFRETGIAALTVF